MKSLQPFLLGVICLALLALPAFAGVSGQGKAVPPGQEQVTTFNGDLVRGPLDVQSGSRTGKVTQSMIEEMSDVQNSRTAVMQRQSLARQFPFKGEPPRVAMGTTFTPLSGVYRIPGDYASVNAAAIALNLGGINGDVTFLLGDGTLSESGFYLGNISGTDTYSVTFQPDSDVTHTTVSLTVNDAFGGGWVFYGTQNVTINGTKKNGTPGDRDLTIEVDPGQAAADYSSTSGTIKIWAPANHITIENVELTAKREAARSRIAVAMEASLTDPVSYVTIDNCDISAAGPAIDLYTTVLETFGDPVSTAAFGRYLKIRNNDIHDVSSDGMHLLGAYRDTISGNNIQVEQFSSSSPTYNFSGRPDGIHILGFYNSIASNLITVNGKGSASRAFGIQDNWPPNIMDAGLLSAPADESLPWLGVVSANTYVNNAIYDIRNDDAASGNRRTVGIGIYGGRYDTLKHNTISFEGAAQAGGANGVYFYGSALHTVRIININNIIKMTRPAGATGINSALLCFDLAGNDYRAPSDYNNYHVDPDYYDVLNTFGPGYTVATLYTDYGQASDGHTLGLDPYLMSETDLHIDSTQPSAAVNNGKALQAVYDLDGVLRNVSTPDIGAYEGSKTGTIHDAGAVAVVSPGPSGVPDGLPFSPITISTHNFTGNVEAGMTLHVEIYNPSSVDVYNHTLSITDSAFAFNDHDFTTAWTPSGAGTYTLKAYVAASGDLDATNDTIVVTFPVAGQKSVPYSSGFESASEKDGWFGSGEWGYGAISNGDTKLGGAHGGDTSWQTVPGPADDPDYYYPDGGGGYYLYSPFFNFTSVTDAYVTFYHSIKLEPEWDRSIFQYSLDTGKTWIKLGELDDTNGVNWYSSAVYQNAAAPNGADCFDEASQATVGLDIVQDPGFWTSNGPCLGDDLPTGPFGFVFQQIRIPDTVYGKSYIRFRYVAAPDFVSGDEGWAFDDFAISTTPQTFAGGSISGVKWHDTNGNGLNDDASPEDSVQIDLRYFGVHVAYDTTDGTGAYSFGASIVNLPGNWQTEVANPASAITTPSDGFYDVFNPADGTGAATITGLDFGDFNGSISGVKWEDLNGDGVKDLGEPGIAGYTIEVHRDSVDGALLYRGSEETDGTGAYSIPVPPGTWYVSEVLDTLVAKQTAPPSGYFTVATSGASGSGTANVTGYNFGNFNLATIAVRLTVDLNANGAVDAGDILAVPSGASSSFHVKKNGVDIAGSPITLGNGTIQATFGGLDTGTYVISEVDSIAGWKRTKGGITTFPITTSSTKDTARYLDYKLIVLTGTKFNDLNGNGVKDGGEPGLAGWTVTVSGGSYLGGNSAVTDGSGNYTIDSIYTGNHTVAEVAQAGWTRTLPGGAGTYTFTGNSGNTVNTAGKDFGNFDNADVSGIVYRDYNGNGVMDPGDTPMSGVPVNLAVNGGIDPSDGSGYSFTGVITTDTIRVTAPVGFVVTQPVAGEYPIALISGGAATNMHFGLFQGTDSSNKYRTFTADQLGADDQKKPGKRPKPGKAYDPVKNKPNTANLVDDLINPKTGQLPGSVKVGLAGQNNLGGKEKCYVKPNKQASLWASLNNKSVHHTGMARGFDLDLKGKPILKLQKAFGPNKKQNNKLFAELLALQLNLVASGTKTPAGLGALIYSDPNSTLDGMTIDQIADHADTVMTNFEFVPLGVYTELDTVVAKINGAFYNAAVDDTSAGWASPKLMWRAYKAVSEVSFLKPNPGATPKQRGGGIVEQVPTEFALEQNYPNPFNPTTTIEFDVPEASLVTLKVYNLLGQEVATLLNREEVEFGDAVEFDASSLPSGVYLYRIVAETIADEDAGIAAETFTQVKKMVLVK